MHSDTRTTILKPSDLTHVTPGADWLHDLVRKMPKLAPQLRERILQRRRLTGDGYAQLSIAGLGGTTSVIAILAIFDIGLSPQETAKALGLTVDRIKKIGTAIRDMCRLEEHRNEVSVERELEVLEIFRPPPAGRELHRTEEDP